MSADVAAVWCFGRIAGTLRPSRHGMTFGTWRLSLAGAQDKLPVVVADDGTVGLTRGGTPSTHILKTPIARLADTVANEAFCLAFGRQLSDRSRKHGLLTVSAAPIVVDGRDALLVERYDRERTGDGVRRLHQEDLCQALGIPTARKYENEGGPTIEACATLLRDVGDPRGLLRFVDAIVLSFLVGNHDAHGKNYSLLCSTGTQRARLAPIYDVLSTAAYHGTTNLTRKMAMRIGGEYRPEYVAERHLSRMAEGTGLNSATLRKRYRECAERATVVSDAVADEFRSNGWWRPIIDDVQAVIARRAQVLHAIAAAAEQ
ncbi:HipA domain-containing protein [Patulibacter sp. NPDC049589]|uniref:HipA domain-containing protein n=1 Tax=Patulibacter sp. NPDC049589 TaxID=3154731 RepID=UPI003444D104